MRNFTCLASIIMCRSVLICILFFQLASATLDYYKFPDDFLFGVATAAYQIEGAINEDGKKDSIWDFGLRQSPDPVVDKSNGNIACDSYHKWREDVELVKNLGADFYRFSIAWTRIIPSGQKGSKINIKGVQHYSNFIDSLLAKGIIPLVTIYHWDLPQNLQENGGWLNVDIVDDYVYYAKILFKLYGDRVKYWLTFNEPFQFCESAHSDGKYAPFLNESGIGGYRCAYNVLLAHGKAYRKYEKEFKATQNGKVGITVNSNWFEPKENTDCDRRAAERLIQFWYGWYMHPVVIGNYPLVMIDRIDARSQEEGFKESRLPKFTEEEIEMIQGSFDFIGLNHYTTILASSSDNFSRPSWKYDCGVKESSDPKWQASPTTPVIKRVPWGMRKLLVWIKEEYGNPSVIITENGWPDAKGLGDHRRVRYLKEYLSEVLKAIYEDGCDVVGYSYWSLIDSFEWDGGYTTGFGLVEVDFNSPNRTRTPRQSYSVYKEIIRSRNPNV